MGALQSREVEHEESMYRRTLLGGSSWLYKFLVWKGWAFIYVCLWLKPWKFKHQIYICKRQISWPANQPAAMSPSNQKARQVDINVSSFTSLAQVLFAYAGSVSDFVTSFALLCSIKDCWVPGPVIVGHFCIWLSNTFFTQGEICHKVVWAKPIFLHECGLNQCHRPTRRGAWG